MSEQIEGDPKHLKISINSLSVKSLSKDKLMHHLPRKKAHTKEKFKSSFIISDLFSCLCYTKMLNNLNTFLPVISDLFIPTSYTHEVEENNLWFP